MVHRLIRPTPARALLVATAGVVLLPVWASTAPKGSRVAPATVVQSDASRARFVVDVPRPTFIASPALEGFEQISLSGFETMGDPAQARSGVGV